MANSNEILLIQAPPWGIYSPPLGIAYLATFLKSYGFSADVLDLNIELFNSAGKEIKEKWHTQDFNFWATGKAACRLSHQLGGLADKILSFGSRIIGFSTTRASVPFLNALLSEIRGRAGKELIIVLGGAGTSYIEIRSLFRKDLIDYFVIGEGEHPFLCLLKDIQKGGSIETNPSCITWRDYACDSAICLKSATPGSIGIDDIPSPDFEEFSLDLYAERDLLSLVSSRGCIRSCNFCCDSPLKKPYRCRAPEKVCEEIGYYVRRYNKRRFEFSDLLINGDLESLERLCDLLIAMDLGIGWGGQATARGDMAAGLFKKLKKAGCGSLAFGCETFSDRVLRLMRKGITAQDAKDALLKAKEAGILADINIIVGFPGETEEDAEESIRFIRENAPLINNINSLNICNIEPGMHIYDHLDEYNIEKAMINDWYAWFNKDRSNTIEIRLERHRRLMTVCSDLGLKPVWQNAQR